MMLVVCGRALKVLVVSWQIVSQVRTCVTDSSNGGGQMATFRPFDPRRSPPQKPFFASSVLTRLSTSYID